MPLIDLKTDFKSLRFGQDRPGGGSSGQPFVQTPIPEQVNPGDTFQSINRGGSRQEIAAINDVDRINNFFNTAAGAQFIIKQNLLPYFSPVVDTNGKFLNTLEKFTEVNLLKPRFRAGFFFVFFGSQTPTCRDLFAASMSGMLRLVDCAAAHRA